MVAIFKAGTLPGRRALFAVCLFFGLILAGVIIIGICAFCAGC